MSVTTTTNRAEYVGNGAQTLFTYPFKIFSNTDLEVYLDGVLQTLTTHYTVTGEGNDNGGEITFLTAPLNGVDVLLLRVLEAKQETVYPSNDKFPAKVHESLADRAVMLIQQLQETDKRALKLAVSSLFTDLTVPDPVAGKFLRWNALLSALENADVATIGGLGVPVSTVDGGTGATTPLGARQNLGLDGQVVKNLTNRTGGSLASGDVAAVSTANDDSVVLGDTSASKQVYAVALESISNLSAGKFLLLGIADCTITGTIARGNYVRKSATTKALEDTGTAHAAATEAPAGSIGVALTAHAAGKARVLFFGRGANAPATASTVPPGSISGFTLSNGTDAANDIDIAAGEAASDETVPANRIWLVGSALTKQLDVTWAAGTNAGGRVSGQALADGTWHVFVFRRSGGAIDYCFSDSLTFTTPDGGTNRRRIGSLRRIGGAIKGFIQDGDYFRWKTPELDVNGSQTSGVYTARSLTVPTAIRVRAVIRYYPSAAVQAIATRPVGASDGTPSITATPLADGRTGSEADTNWKEELTDTSGQIETSTDATGTILVATLGYHDRRGRG